MNIRALAFTAIAMGALVLGLTAALPWIAEQSYAVTLKRYGSEHLATAMAHDDLVSRWVGILVTVILGATSVAAGVFLLKHRRLGARLWVGVCAGFIAFSLVDFARSGLSAAGILRLIFWGIALLVSIPVLRRQGPAWFARKA